MLRFESDVFRVEQQDYEEYAEIDALLTVLYTNWEAAQTEG